MKTLAFALACVAIGFALGYGLAGSSRSRETEESSPTGALGEAASERAAAIDLEERLATAEAENRGLEAENADLRKLIAAADATEESTEESATADDALPVSFGEFASLEELQNADWRTLAAAIRAIDAEVVALQTALAEGKEPDAQLQMKIMAENAKLQKYAISLIGKLPTNQSGNGEFSHPISVANLVSAYLEDGQVPLEASQRERLAELGRAYGDAFERVSGRYDEGTYALEKLLDEVELKNDFVGRMYESLTPEQESIIQPGDIRGRAGLDTFSPAVMLMMKAQPMTVSSREELRGELASGVAERLGLDRGRVEQSWIMEEWIAEMDSILEPQPRYLHSMFKAEEAVVAGRAQLRALQALADEFGLDDAKREQLRQLQLMIVPRVAQD